MTLAALIMLIASAFFGEVESNQRRATGQRSEIYYAAWGCLVLVIVAAVAAWRM